ncbi:hypothetical protein [Methylomonas sp. AM2-LC]|uniref:hypothetical protein n=1 Tax=Methylomonas sp. AM2-LC TaxID=3153301 RepID=UPI0032678712
MERYYKITVSSEIKRMTNEEFNMFVTRQIKVIKSRKVSRSIKERLISELSSQENYISILEEKERDQLSIDIDHKLKKNQKWMDYIAG